MTIWLVFGLSIYNFVLKNVVAVRTARLLKLITDFCY